MAKFIELESYDLIASKTNGVRCVNVDCIKELVGTYTEDTKTITRVILIDDSFIDVVSEFNALKAAIENVQ